MISGMTQREKIIVGVSLGVLLLITGIGFYYRMWGGRPYEEPLEGNKTVEDLPPYNVLELQENKYTAETPKNVTESVAVAEAPITGNPSVKQGFYDINMSRDGFSPNSIAVKRGNLVKIRVTAVDGDYDFRIPYTEMSIFIKKGETKPISFQATASGTFLFECRDACPLNKKVSGTLVVIP